jgi:hypothetical protein
MNQTSPQNSQGDHLRQAPLENNLDRLLSDFFKSKMKQPWPAAPATPTRLPLSEPSVLAASRNSANSDVETTRNQPATAGPSRDRGNKSRYTLAVSVAVLLGTCWYLSNGSLPSERNAPGSNNAPKLDMFPDAGASDPAVLKEKRKAEAEKGTQGVVQPKIQMP